MLGAKLCLKVLNIWLNIQWTLLIFIYTVIGIITSQEYKTGSKIFNLHQVKLQAKVTIKSNLV